MTNSIRLETPLDELAATYHEEGLGWEEFFVAARYKMRDLSDAERQRLRRIVEGSADEAAN